MPISSSVRMTRMAISPRLATRTLVNTEREGYCAARGAAGARLVRVGALEELLASQHLSGAHQGVDLVAAVLVVAARLDAVLLAVASRARHRHQPVLRGDLAVGPA